MGLDRKLEARLDDRGRDRVVPAAGAQGRDRALVVAVRIAERILRQRRMMELWLDDVGHDESAFTSKAWILLVELCTVELGEGIRFDLVAAVGQRLERAVRPPAVQALARMADASDLQARVLVVIGVFAGDKIDAICALSLQPFQELAGDRNEADDQ